LKAVAVCDRVLLDSINIPPLQIVCSPQDSSSHD